MSKLKRKRIIFDEGDTVLFLWGNKRYKGTFLEQERERHLVTSRQNIAGIYYTPPRLGVPKVNVFCTNMALTEKVLQCFKKETWLCLK